MAILLVQATCAVFFVSDIVFTLVGLRTDPISWQTRELLEIGAAIGLVLGVVLGGVALHRTMRHSAQYRDRLRAASGAFMDLMEERFDEWGLTPSERDVALFAVKGLSTRQIAELRSTSQGTVKAQTNAIYRKAGVSGRPQLLSLFIDDLMDDALLPRAG
ncbi:hypothetical protein C2I36_09015 [Rhodobacteraceae bacterium WD3A24]|nr:hypothetical protein C2I36_09015 [Rhodobacteraceae bacterium WD3A24]